MSNSFISERTKSDLILAVKWLFSIIFLLIGLIALIINVRVGIPFLLAGLLILPPLANKITNTIPFYANNNVQLTVAVVLIFVGGHFIDKEKQDKADELKQYHDNIVAYVNANSSKPIFKNLLLLNDNYNLFTDNENKLWEFGDTNIFALYPKERMALYSPMRTSNLDSKYFLKEDDTKGSITNYELVFAFDSNNNVFTSNAIVRYSNGEEIQWEEKNAEDLGSLLLVENITTARKISETRRAEQAEQERKRKLAYQRQAREKSFASDCIVAERCIEAESYLKRNYLKDPDSFDPIKTVWYSKDDGNMYVAIKYRARNGFGGMSMEGVEILMGDDCQAVAITETIRY